MHFLPKLLLFLFKLRFNSIRSAYRSFICFCLNLQAYTVAAPSLTWAAFLCFSAYLRLHCLQTTKEDLRRERTISKQWKRVQKSRSITSDEKRKADQILVSALFLSESESKPRLHTHTHTQVAIWFFVFYIWGRFCKHTDVCVCVCVKPLLRTANNKIRICAFDLKNGTSKKLQNKKSTNTLWKCTHTQSVNLLFLLHLCVFQQTLTLSVCITVRLGI